MRSSVRPFAAGLVAAVVLLAGCVTDGSGTEGAVDTGAPARGVVSSNLNDLVPKDAHVFTGTVARDGAGYGVTAFTLEVPDGAVGVHAVGEWAPDAPLQLRIASPEGEVTKSAREVPGRERAATVTPPTPGTWTLRVVSPAEAEHSFTVRAWVAMNVTDARVDEKLALGPGEWLEMNVVLEEGATLQWAFDAESEVTFDVHSHSPTGGVVTHAQGQARQQSGAFTAPETNVYSFFAQGADGSPVTLLYAVKGPFRVSSRILG